MRELEQQRDEIRIDYRYEGWTVLDSRAITSQKCERFRGGLGHRVLYRSTLCSRAIQKKKTKGWGFNRVECFIWKLSAHVHPKTLEIYKLASRNFTTRNRSLLVSQSRPVVILIETKFMNFKCLHMILESFAFVCRKIFNFCTGDGVAAGRISLLARFVCSSQAPTEAVHLRRSVARWATTNSEVGSWLAVFDAISVQGSSKHERGAEGRAKGVAGIYIYM